MNSKFFVKGIAGGVTYFLLGWVVYGMLLMGFMTEHSNTALSAIMRPEAEFVYWSMLLGNISFGFLLTYVLDKANISDVTASATTGAVVGLLVCTSYNLMMNAHMNMSDMTAIGVDIVATTLIAAVVGAVIGLVGGRMK